MIRILPLFLAILLFQFLANGQSDVSHDVRVVFPEVALLNIAHPAGPVSLTEVHDPAEVVQCIPLNGNPGYEYWINYSSMVRGGKPERKVVASLTGEIPEGISVSVEAADCTGSGKGKTGIPAGKKQLTGMPEEIISGIGSCYTGKGTTNGHLIRLTIDVNPVDAQASQMPGHLMVTYRITD